MLKGILVLSTIVILLSCQSPKEKDFDKEKYRAELSGYAKEYMMGLKSVLIKNMQQGGPLQAVNVCSDTAADLTKSYSRDKNVDVKRFSFKNRNDANIPDLLEEKALKSFETLISKGNLTAETASIEKEIIDGKEAVRYIKPILVEAPCLNCHGAETQISEDVANVLNQKYPNDKAKGYKIGDLRGAISITKIL